MTVNSICVIDNWEDTLGRNTKKGTQIARVIFTIIITLPLCSGESSDEISAFHGKQRHSSTLFIASRMKIIIFESITRAFVE